MQSFESLQHSDQASIIIVDNDSTPESKIALNKIVKNSNIDIKIIISPKNLYYWGAANYALDQIDLNANNHPEWIIICNNDILFSRKDLLSKIMNYNSKDYPVLAPAIFSSKTKKDLNPFMEKQINYLAKLYYSLFYINSITGFIIYKFRQFLKMIVSIFNRSMTKSKFIYAPHGSFIIFSKNFFQSGGYLDQNLTMYGEEFTTAEIANKLNIPIYYEPDIEVVHVEHSSSKINWFNNFHLTKKAYYYFLKEYLND